MGASNGISGILYILLRCFFVLRDLINDNKVCSAVKNTIIRIIDIISEKKMLPYIDGDEN
jgi:lantibiotic modifying enzyme